MKTATENIKNNEMLPPPKLFLTREFLIWLWYESENHKSGLTLKGKGKSKYKVNFWIEDKIIFEASAENSMRQTFLGGMPSKSAEVALALKSGKLVSELRLGIDVASFGIFYLCLNCKDLSLKSLKMPEMQASDNQNLDDEISYDLRLEQMVAISEIVDGLFEFFLTERLSSDWNSKKLKDITKWIHQRITGRNQLLN